MVTANVVEVDVNSASALLGSLARPLRACQVNVNVGDVKQAEAVAPTVDFTSTESPAKMVWPVTNVTVLTLSITAGTVVGTAQLPSMNLVSEATALALTSRVPFSG